MEMVSMTVCVIGDPNVGKSSLLASEAQTPAAPGRTNPSIIPVAREDGTVVHYVDLPGAPRFKRMANRYCSSAAAFVLVYDQSDKSTFDHLDDWLSQIGDTSASVLFLVGNKADVPVGPRSVQIDDAREYANARGMTLATVSATKTPDAVRTLFAQVRDAVRTRLEPALLPNFALATRVLLRQPSSDACKASVLSGT